MKIRKTMLDIATIVALTSLPAAALAAGPTDAEKRSACTSDVLKLCFSKIGNMDKVEGCLRDNRPKLSGTCKALFDKYDAVPSQKAESASPSPSTSAVPATASAPAVAQPAYPAETARAPSPAETPRTPVAVVAPAPAETPRTPVAVAPSPAETPRTVEVAPSTNETTTSFQPCDMIDCSRLPAPMQKVVRDMPISMDKVMRDMPAPVAKMMRDMPAMPEGMRNLFAK